MKLEAATVERYRNFVDPQRITIEPDVTCLVGKNEAGKTTILKALHRLKPANVSDVKFDLTTEYPRWRLARDRRKDPDLANTAPIRAAFSLSADERDELGKVFGLNLPEATRCNAYRTYANSAHIWLECTVAQAAETVAQQVCLDADDLASLPLDVDLSEVAAAAKKLAKEHRESGEKARAHHSPRSRASLRSTTPSPGTSGQMPSRTRRSGSEFRASSTSRTTTRFRARPTSPCWRAS